MSAAFEHQVVGARAPDAIAAARAASTDWGKLSIEERVQRLQPAADFIRAHLDELADAIREENGKPRTESIGHELMPAVAYVRWLASAAPEVLGSRQRPLKWLPHRRCDVHHRPYGVVLVISPWNIPFLIPFSQVLGALAAGNSVVLKPSEVTPVIGGWVGRAIAACELPENVFQVVQGSGLVGASLVDARPDKVLFTGSVATGRKVMKACAEHPIPVSLELGGIDAAVVMPDADLEYAASAISWGATFNHGQVCASVERVIAHRDVYEELLERIADKMEQINPWEDLSRITFGGQKDVLNNHLADAKARGHTARTGGEWIRDDKLQPTLFASETIDEADVWRHESFGPVLAAVPYDDEADAVALHNGTEFGLTASVFTGDVEAGRRLAEQLRAGNVSVNDLGAMHYSQPELPWGGVGASGFGRSHGPEGLLAVTWPQVIDASRLGASEPKRPWFYPYDYALEDALKSFVDVVAARGPVARAAAAARTVVGLAKSITNHGRT